MPGPYTQVVNEHSARSSLMASSSIKHPTRLVLQDSRTAYPATVELKVSLSSDVGVQKLKSKLLQMEGVKQVKMELRKEKLTVTGHVKAAEVLKTVRKVQKGAELWIN
ncbi:hypothetical protein Mp_2g25910 [Marchantia polymorpha subsp. ruderalis]|uniref:HMA domain-containing protein n=2 Tax=Marchantia polymorpha TaxID=3197 RepID=A0A176VFU7_MARPO|nr:hypothetical protein AXG93_4448s1010 [Marchantia polymorpha subsp. ruderalis]PTQ43404.1 hypothetical protein MARPO_0025s0088 [Marchantia polymorpha]BBN03729.1 hypothetical protein Mp_2g25910 [Marchantia polymorpha subsp. ruderalis]|eukprot:PTQ43404.1 hypothetical protein MARPO_0025s0088 [Marchantia polymorpha]